MWRTDPLSYLFVLPGVVLALWARRRVAASGSEGSRIPIGSGLSGAEAAAAVLQAAGVSGVRVEAVSGALTDYYDPRQKVLRLSREVYSGRSLAALGVAAREAGHAIQDASRYPGLIIRNLIVPAAGIGSSVSWLFLIAGLVLGIVELVFAAFAVFSLNVALQLVNVPVEYDASRRARAALLAAGLVSPREDETVSRVLDAAAWTYVAATLTSALTSISARVRRGGKG
jgi:uncharacterized protein